MINSRMKSIPGEPTYADCRLEPKRKADHITLDNIERELFEQGYSGQLVCLLMSVPEEFPDDNIPFVDIYSPEGACKELARFNHWLLRSENGKEIPLG